MPIALRTAAALFLALCAALPAGAATIHKGDKLQPPKHSDFNASRKQEEAWFNSLERTTIAELRPGDLLLRKHYDQTVPVVNFQRPLRADKGTAFTVHAMIYLGNGQIGHASNHDGHKVMVSKLADEKIDVLVYRPTDAAQAKSAAETMRWMTGLGLDYSVKHCFESGLHKADWGPVAKGRAAKVAARKVPVDDKQMMCSEAAAYAYQGTKNAYIELDAMRVSPMHLEDWINDHPGKFRFAGVLKQQ